MIQRQGNLLTSTMTALAVGEGVFDAVIATSELRAAAEPDPAVPVVMKVGSERPHPGEDWPTYKERVGGWLGKVADRLADNAGIKIHQHLVAANSLATNLTADQLAVVAMDPEVVVELVELDPLIDATKVDGMALDIGLPAVLAVHPQLTGAGVRVAVLDSGIDGAHPALTVTDAVSTCGEPVAIPGSHGTHCAGILASHDQVLRGVAPGIELVDVKVLRANGTGRHTFIVRGIDEALDRDVDICSMSLGFNHLPTDSAGGHGWQCPDGACPMCFAVDNATLEGVLMVVAAGNDHLRAQQLVAGGRGHHYDTEVCCPGQARNALTVGNHTKATFAPYPSSSTGPAAWAGLKPDLVAPGAQILSTIPLPRDAAGTPQVNAPRALQFGLKTGTSMATPAVAGACALLMQRAMETGGPHDPTTIRQALLTRQVVPLGGPANVVGAGRLHLQL